MAHETMLVSDDTRVVLREAVRVIVAAVWLFAGTTKLLSPESTRDSVRRLVGGSARTATAVARLLPVLELSLGALLLVTAVVRVAAMTSAAMFVLFAGFVGASILRDSTASAGCGCFGVRRPAPHVDPHAGPRAIARNLVLAALAVVVAGA